MGGADAVILAEVAEVLARHGRLRCIPDVEARDGRLAITLTLAPRPAAAAGSEGAEALAVASLADEVQYLVDVAAMRALCHRYNIDSRVLEALLDKKED